MHDQVIRIREKLADLRSALEQFSEGNRDQLFESRDILRDVTDALAASAWSHASVVCEAVQKTLGNVLRHGGLLEQDAIELAGELLTFVDETLQRPAPGLAHPKITHGPGPLPSVPVAEGANASQQPYTPLGGSIRISPEAVDETRIGELLVHSGRITGDQLQQALALQQVCRKRLGEVLLSMGVINEAELELALEEQRRITLRIAEDLSSGGGLELRIGRLGG